MVRDMKFKVLNLMMAKGKLPPASGPCMPCGVPDVVEKYHDEGCSEPCIREPPLLLGLCPNCHGNNLHKGSGETLHGMPAQA
jgi:hypothetical protein